MGVLRRMKLFCIFCALLALFGCTADKVNSSEFDLKIEISPSSYTIQTGESFPIEIMINECSQPIFGLSLQIEYNLELIFCENPASLATCEFFGSNSISFIQINDNIIHLAFSLMQGEQPVSGSEILCTIYLEAVAAGITEIVILPNSVNAFDTQGSPLEIDLLILNNALVEII